MKFAVLGATGPTGLMLIEECLGQGHQVKALVRNPDKLTIKHDNLTVEKVNIFQKDELVIHFRGMDAVFSCLGQTAMFWMSCTLYSTSVIPITEAVREAGVIRIVLMSGYGSRAEPGLGWVIRWFVRPVMLRNYLRDLERMEEYIEHKCQDLDFTVVRPPGLTNARSSGKEVSSIEGQRVPNTRLTISRRDVAKFMLKSVNEGLWKKKFVAIGIK